MFYLGPQERPAAGLGPAAADYGAILDALPDAVFIHEAATGRILEVNQACLDMFGYTAEAMGDLDVESLSSGEPGYRGEDAGRWLHKALTEGRAEFLWRSKRAGGSHFWSEVRLLHAGAGRVVAVVRDISDRTQAEEALGWAEEKFETIFRSSPACIMLASFPDGRVLEANEPLLRLTGYQREELIGRVAVGFWVSQEARDRYLGLLQAERRVVGLESSFRMKDGEVRIGRLSGELLDLPGGPCILTLIEDITERKAHEAALSRITRLYAALSMVNQSIVRVQDEEELYATICRALVVGGGFWAAWIAAPEPVTHRFLKLAAHGGRPDWMEGLEIYASDDRPEGRGTMGRAFREGRPVIANDFDQSPLSAPWRDAARSREFKAVASFPLTRGGGKVFGVLCIYAREAGYFGAEEIALLNEVCGDITYSLDKFAQEEQQRVLEARLRETQKLESLGTLAGGVAHDMNNVLGAILGLASIELDAADPALKLHRSLDAIVQACIRGRDVVQGLLCFARRDLGELRPVDLNQLVRELVALLGHTTLQRIRFVQDLEPGLRCVEGDPAALNHALMNICVNAVDAMPGGGTITIRTRNAPDGAVTVVLEDTGEGMPEEVLQRATEPFFTTKPAGKGTGIGLAMVYGTVQAHHGTMTLASRPGQGTQVHLGFPGSDRRPEAPALAEAGAEPPKLRVLVVDDDEMLRETVCDVLAWQGHVPEAARGGQEALDVLAKGGAYDLIVLDLNMPGMSGAEALPKILDLRPGQRILVASGFTDQTTKGLLDGRPSVRSISKPFTSQELALKLRAW